VSFEHGLHDPALHAFPASVDEPHFLKAALRGSSHVLIDD
jgi:hypothetical protein